MKSWTKSYEKLFRKTLGSCVVTRESNYLRYDFLRTMNALSSKDILPDFYRSLELYIFYELAINKMRGSYCLVLGGEDQRVIWDTLKKDMLERENINLITAYLPLVRDNEGKIIPVANTDTVPSMLDSKDKIKDKLENWGMNLENPSNIWGYCVRLALLWEGEMNVNIKGTLHQYHNLKGILDDVRGNKIDIKGFKENLINKCQEIFRSLQ